MRYLHYDLNLDANDTVEVTLDHQANVFLVDDTNFANYKAGRQYSYYGGLAKRSPIHLSPPHAGSWHLVVNLGGYAGHVNASVRVI